MIYSLPMSTIILHGYLNDLHPEPIEVEATSAAEALTFLNLIPALNRVPGERHSVQVDGFDSVDALYDRRDNLTLHVRPVMAGSGRGGMGQIILGAVMVAVAIWNPAALGAIGISQGSLALAGAMMMLGGVLQALAPQPELHPEERSRYLGNGKNTVAIGTRIPMIYGRHKAYGHYISFDIDSDKFDAAPKEWYSSPFTNYGELTHSAAEAQIPMTPPSQRDLQPTSQYAGISHPESMVEEYKTFINFSPAIVLLAGPYDISFENGQILHVHNDTAGTTSRVTLLGGDVLNLPATGTPIAFTRNYG